MSGRSETEALPAQSAADRIYNAQVKSRFRAAAAILAMAGSLFVSSAESASADQTGAELISEDLNGEPAGGGSANISSDGRFVIYNSPSENIVTDDTNNKSDFFLEDRLTGSTELISVASDETHGNNHTVGSADVTSDGKYVVFGSKSSNLVAGDMNGVEDTFIRDRELGVTELVSQSTNGTRANDNAAFGNPDITDDGRYVAFSSRATNLGDGSTDPSRNADVFLRDRELGITTQVSLPNNGEAANNHSYEGSVSADGRYVVFTSYATNLVPGESASDRDPDVFLWDRDTNEIELISKDADGNPAQGNSGVGSQEPSITDDGRYIAFASGAGELVGDNDNTSHIYLFDREQNKMTRLTESAETDSHDPDISGDGRFIAFTSWDDSLSSQPDTNEVRDVYVVDREWGTTSRVSSAENGEPNNHSWESSVANNGATVFRSRATNIAPGDTNNMDDVFLGYPDTVYFWPETIQQYALGDSFSSGEGTFEYENQACHRGSRAWPRLLDEASSAIVETIHRACTGARTMHLTHPWTEKGEPAQIPSEPQPDVDLVTLTIGGNDVEFGTMLTHCVMTSTFNSGCEQWANSSSTLGKVYGARLNVLREALIKNVYPAIEAAFPKAIIVHVGYPRLFPLRGIEPISCDWLSPEEQEAGEYIVLALNSTIKTAATFTDRVKFINPVSVFTGHEMCTEESWVNIIVGHPALFGTEQGHPNFEGQQAYSHRVSRAIDIQIIQ